jgi:hypothetical protein
MREMKEWRSSRGVPPGPVPAAPGSCMRHYQFTATDDFLSGEIYRFQRSVRDHREQSATS